MVIACTSCLKTRVDLKPESTPEEVNKGISLYAVDELRSELTKIYNRLDFLEQKTNSLDQELVQIKNTPPPPPPPPPTPVSQNLDEKLFIIAQGLHAIKHFDLALEKLNRFFENPVSEQIADATFLRAECFFELKQYPKAILDYSKFQNEFKNHPNAAIAMYQIGMSFEFLKQPQDAKSFFEMVIELFPKSKYAKLAKKKIKK